MDYPLQSVARWTAEQKSGAEAFVLQQAGEKIFYVCDVVKVKTDESAVLDQLLLSSLPECAGEGHVVKVCAFEFPLVVFCCEAAELFGDFCCF